MKYSLSLIAVHFFSMALASRHHHQPQSFGGIPQSLVLANNKRKQFIIQESWIIIPRGGSYYGNDGKYDNDDDNYYYNQDDGGYRGQTRQREPQQYNDDSYYYREDEFNDRGKSGGIGRGVGSAVLQNIQSGNRKIGIPLLGLGAAFTLLGMSLFFNKALMRLGNLFFCAGIPVTIGPGRTAGYFFQPKKARATGCLTAGIVLVFLGWPILGIILETFGFLNLFGNMFPVAMAILKNMPVIGPILKGGNSSSNRRNNRRDSYYEGYEPNEDDRYYEDRNSKWRDEDDNQSYY